MEVSALAVDQGTGSLGNGAIRHCRETAWPGEEFRTQATALFSVPAGGAPALDYQINGNPRTNPLKPFKT